MYGKPENSGENSDGTVHRGGLFPEKKLIPYLSRYYLFSFVTETTEIFCNSCWDYQCQAQFKHNSSPFLFSVPKKYEYHVTENFRRNFLTNGKCHLSENGSRFFFNWARTRGMCLLPREGGGVDCLQSALFVKIRLVLDLIQRDCKPRCFT